MLKLLLKSLGVEEKAQVRPPAITFVLNILQHLKICSKLKLNPKTELKSKTKKIK